MALSATQDLSPLHYIYTGNAACRAGYAAGAVAGATLAGFKLYPILGLSRQDKAMSPSSHHSASQCLSLVPCHHSCNAACRAGYAAGAVAGATLAGFKLYPILGYGGIGCAAGILAHVATSQQKAEEQVPSIKTDS